MYNFRYYAIGHSYLLHGPFPGWQTDGFWGMAASEPGKDYFHRFQQLLSENFDCKIEALAENHADYERLCVQGATKDDYTSSKQYEHMKEVLIKFKPNIISVFVGGGNTAANDEKSISQFFDVLYEMIAKYKRPDAVVVCPNLRKSMWEANKKMALKHGLIPVDTSEIHDKRGYENPYHAFIDYPEYDEKAAAGAVEFRTHPSNAGHDLIANKMFNSVKDAIVQSVSEGDFAQTYSYKEYLLPEKLSKLQLLTEPADLLIDYYGFNLRQDGDCITFGSAPNTGASLAAERIWIHPKYNVFHIEMAVKSEQKDIPLSVELTLKNGALSFTETIKDSDMHRYEFDISANTEWIKSLRVTPSSTECVISVRTLGFKE